MMGRWAEGRGGGVKGTWVWINGLGSRNAPVQTWQGWSLLSGCGAAHGRQPHQICALAC